MNIAVVSLATPNIESYASLSRLQREVYCKKHGYHYYDYWDSLDLSKHPSWSRIYALREVLNSTSFKYDYVCWMDADTIITSLDFKLETVIETYSKSGDCIFISKDFNGYNDGVHILKNTSTARNFLEDTEELYPDFKKHIWWSQGAYMLLLRLSFYKNKVCQVPCNVWNSYLDVYEYKNTINVWTPDSFILHLPVFSKERRTEIFKKVLNGDFNFPKSVK